MITFALWGMFLGIMLPFISGRFGKLIPADPGDVILRLYHRPRRPHNTNDKRYLLWKEKRKQLFYWACFWGILNSILFVLIHLLIPNSMQILSCVFVWTICALIIIDAQYWLLPDFFTLPLLLLGVLFSVDNPSFSVENSLTGAIGGYLVSVFSVLAMAFSPKKELGCGDIKMITALGAWLGIMGLSITLILSFLFFIIYTVLNLHKKGAYGPALGSAALISFFLMHMK